MQKHTYRTILIWAIIAVALFQIYPTIGWMTLDEEERQERLARWAEEDLEYRPPSFWRDTWDSLRRWAEFDRDHVITLGLDLQGGVHMVLGLDMDELDESRKQEFLDQGYTEEDIEREMQQIALQRVRRRVEEFEARDPVIQTMGANQIQVQLPGERDIERAQELITRTARLTFHAVAGTDETRRILRDIEQEFPNQLEPFVVRPGLYENFHAVRPADVDSVRHVIEQAREVEGLIPEDRLVRLSTPPNPWDEQLYYIYVLEEEPLATGEGLRLAVARPDQQSIEGHWMVLFQNEPQAARRFGEITQQNIGNPMAIVVDNQVVSAPTIQSRIAESGQITGRFTQEQAQDLAIALNSGSMPVPIREDFTGVVGASLGADSVQRGITSALVGLAIVLVFMLFYYRFAGLIANIGLMLNAVFVVACFAYFNFTLTLPGIAGLILTIGMAVDANVLIFERIREELRNGKSLLSSIDSGYARATVTILDANVTTLIAAAVLMHFGTGPIEGFAIALAIGVCCSVFTALVISRAMFDFLARMEWIKGTLNMSSLFKPESQIHFMDRRKLAGVVSVAAILVGMSVFTYRGNDNFGVDFTAGTSMIVNFESEETVDIADVRAALQDAGISDPVVQEYGDQTVDANRFMIRIGEQDQAELMAGGVEGAADFEDADGNGDGEEEAAGDERAGFTQETMTNLITAALTPVLDQAAAQLEFDQVEMVGPAVGDQLKWDALQAIGFALLFIIIYLWFRFQINFALGAVIALIHDVLITVGLFALVGRQLSLPVVAALLTIIGYSLNDTIIVYDRIREDMRAYRGRGLGLPEIMNISINHTLGRTLITSTTTLFVLLVLFFFGGPVINDFAFALIAGVLVGTYSSIFVASPIIHLLNLWQGKYVTESGKGEVDKSQTGRRRRRRKDRGKDKAAEGDTREEPAK